MITHHKIEGYESYQELIKQLYPKEPVVLFFCGSRDSSGISWCSDCNAADPVVKVALEKTDKTFHFIHVAVGSRELWKSPSCPFRTDPMLKLVAVPTLLILGKVERLTEDECCDQDNVEMLLDAI